MFLKELHFERKDRLFTARTLSVKSRVTEIVACITYYFLTSTCATPAFLLPDEILHPSLEGRLLHNAEPLNESFVSSDAGSK